MPVNNKSELIQKLEEKISQKEKLSEKETEIFEKHKFRQLIASGWHNELEGVGHERDSPRKETYCGIPHDIKNQEMVEITYLFQSMYGKELKHRIESEPPIEMRKGKELIKRRLFYVWYKNSSEQGH
jgi:hypothetical protein